MQSGKTKIKQREKDSRLALQNHFMFSHLRCGIIFFLDTITLVFLMPIMVVGIIDTAMESVGTLLSLFLYAFQMCSLSI